MDGVAQATLDELQDVNHRRPKPNKKWFITQLQIYGVPYRENMTLAQLKQALKNALTSGLVSFHHASTHQTHQLEFCGCTVTDR